MGGKGQPESKRTQSLLALSESDDNVTFTAEDWDMLHEITKQLRKLDVLNDFKSDISELKQAVEYNNALMEELKKEQKSLKEDERNLENETTILTKAKSGGDGSPP